MRCFHWTYSTLCQIKFQNKKTHDLSLLHWNILQYYQKNVISRIFEMSDCFLARFEFPTGCHFSSCPDSIFLELAGLDFLSTFSCYEGSLDVSIVAWICYLFSSFRRPYWNSSAVLSSCLNESVDSRQNLEIPRIVSILERNNHQHVSVLFESQLVQVLRQ